MQAKQMKKFFQQLPSAACCSVFLKKAGLHHLGKTRDRSEHPSLFLSSPSFIRWVWCQRLCNVLLVSWGQFSWLCPLRTTCAFPASSLVGWVEQKKISWCCISTGLQQQKHPCVTNPGLITNSKCSLIPATENKNNSIQVKTSSVNKCLVWKLLGV